MNSTLWQQDFIIQHTQILLDSFERYLKRPLIQRENALKDAENLFKADFVVASHGTQSDPILNYGNQTALDLWSLSFEEFTRLASRYTAEPVHQSERAAMLQRGREFGFIDNYQGVRISSSGKRFKIEQAIIWNLVDNAGNPYGQAATFSHWTGL